jgi:DNA-binding transcriptional LysR family regulator
LYAAQGYISRPSGEWQFIAYHAALDHVPEQVWLLDFADGRRIGFRSNDLVSQLAAAREGLGIAALPDFFAADDKGVIALPVDADKLSRDIYLIAHVDMRRQAAVRLVMDFIAEKFVNDFDNGEQ